MPNDSSKSTSLIDLQTLTIVFVVLKLTKVINWSWWWVLSTLWIPAGLAILAVVVVILLEKILK